MSCDLPHCDEGHLRFAEVVDEAEERLISSHAWPVHDEDPPATALEGQVIREAYARCRVCLPEPEKPEPTRRSDLVGPVWWGDR